MSVQGQFVLTISVMEVDWKILSKLKISQSSITFSLVTKPAANLLSSVNNSSQTQRRKKKS